MNDRVKFIGGSEVAAVLGLSQWRTPLQVYLSKRGDAEPDTDDDRKRDRILARGRREEPHIIADMEKLTPIKVTRKSYLEEGGNRHWDAAMPFLSAEVDAEWLVTPEAVDYLRIDRGIEIDDALMGTTQNLEAKTAHPFVAMKKFGGEGTDEMPIEYYAQAMHGLMVTRRQVALLALAVYVDDPILYVVRRDEETIAGMREKLRTFWQDHVLKGAPPPLTNVPDVYRMLKRRLATKVEATPDVAAMVRSLRVLTDRRAATEEAIDALQFEIGSFLLGADAMDNPDDKARDKHVVTVAGEPMLTIAQQEQKRIDQDRLRANYPAIARECTKTSKFFKFSLTRRKT